MVLKPMWIHVGLKYLGVTEIPGPKTSTVILGWLKKLGAWWTDDETPWCGTFVQICFNESGIRNTIKNWYRAKAWLEFGIRVTPRVGAVGVKSRDGGGHVFFYVAEDATHYHILEGNGSNKVQIRRLPKGDVMDWRWPTNIDPMVYGPNLVKPNGLPVGGTES